MDFTTLFGALAMAALLARGAVTGEISSAFLNWHGLGLVLGGTAAAILINTPGRYVLKAFKAMFSLIETSPYARPERATAALVALAAQAQGRGSAALRDVDPRAAGGFLAHAAQIAREHNDPAFVREVLEADIDQAYDVENETANVFRSMGVLSPMFGLVGTLIGIVNVLKELSNPELVGGAMAVAITSAFYGILLANVVCVPVAGKLRIRSLQALKTKTVVLEGVLLIMQGAVPAVVETKLQAYGEGD